MDLFGKIRKEVIWLMNNERRWKKGGVVGVVQSDGRVVPAELCVAPSGNFVDYGSVVTNVPEKRIMRPLKGFGDILKAQVGARRRSLSGSKKR